MTIISSLLYLSHFLHSWLRIILTVNQRWHRNCTLITIKSQETKFWQSNTLIFNCNNSLELKLRLYRLSVSVQWFICTRLVAFWSSLDMTGTKWQQVQAIIMCLAGCLLHPVLTVSCPVCGPAFESGGYSVIYSYKLIYRSCPTKFETNPSDCTSWSLFIWVNPLVLVSSLKRKAKTWSGQNIPLTGTQNGNNQALKISVLYLSHAILCPGLPWISYRL